MRRGVGLVLTLFCVAAGPNAVSEPIGYWTGSAQAPVPQSIAGGAVIHTAALRALLRTARPILVDVAAAPRKPSALAPGALWMPLGHRDIPGSLWIPDAGLGVVSDRLDAFFRSTLRQATHGDPNAAIVVYCHHACWLSWNASKRAIADGYRNVFWYPDGVEGWSGAGLPVAAAHAEWPK
jgi:PQQ-dependent catabolism-associated CXXCW motif protein